MFIKEIILNNFRIYQGHQALAFEKDRDRNVYIISGNNGYGKTSLLTSLVWCLYGKHMQEVDDSFKRQILDMGGYRKYILSCLNNIAATKGETVLSIGIKFSEISVPGFSCNEISINRTYFTDREHEELEILIDGKSNELVQEVGKEIFIHDFILPKEIAKFFFFDAEKNVSLAEIKSTNDRKNLSKAYSEILGIKKYEDLKNHINDLRLRYRKNSASNSDASKLNSLEQEIEQLSKIITEKHEKLIELGEEKIELKLKSDKLQEKLIREGSSLSLEQVKKLQYEKIRLQKNHDQLKHAFVELIDLAPFAITGNLLLQVEKQLNTESESNSRQLPAELIKKKVKDILQGLKDTKPDNFKIDRKTKNFFESIVSGLLEKHLTSSTRKVSDKVIHNFNKEEYSHFHGIMQHLRTSYKVSLINLNQSIRNNRIEFNRVNKQLLESESKETDKLIQTYRQDKIDIDNKVVFTEDLIININKEVSISEHQLANKKRIKEELEKKVKVETRYIEKDLLAAKLVSELNVFIIKIKNEKREALEAKIQNSLSVLMHKNSFITKVKVEIENDMLDIHLFHKKTEIIKDNLSKGEQQIYATALLKALVEESNIDFPVFVDSPMQKYDTVHSSKIITEFYPVISKQVVLFPLLNKEISKEEFKLLEPYIKDTYLIKNSLNNGSFFVKLQPGQLFNTQNLEVEYAN